jgi:hypothetical protein
LRRALAVDALSPSAARAVHTHLNNSNPNKTSWRNLL